MRRLSFALFLCWTFTTQTTVSPLPPVIRIGGIFPEEFKGTPSEIAFKYAVFAVNRERKLLSNSTLVHRTLFFKHGDVFQATKIGCQLIAAGISALFATGIDSSLESHLRSLSFALDLPLILPTSSIHEESTEGTTEAASNGGGAFSFPTKLAPSKSILGEALKDAVNFFNWTRVALLYEENDGLFQVEDLIRKEGGRGSGATGLGSLLLPKGGVGSRRGEIFPRQVDPSSLREILKEIKRRDIFHIIVDTVHLHLLFRTVLQLQMNDARYHYHFTTMDLELYDLEDFAYNSVNITSFRLIQYNPANDVVLEDMQRFNHPKSSSKVFRSEAALIYDSVLSFSHGLRAIDGSHEIRGPNMSCDREQSWSDGLSLLNYINSVSFDGLTGSIQLRDGVRNDLTLTLLKLKNASLQPVGLWSASNRLVVHDHAAFSSGDSVNITLRVTTVLEKPYVMKKLESNLTGNARYEGFCIDLLKDVANLVGFEYTIEAVEDGKYGVEDPLTKEWNGVVKELIHGLPKKPPARLFSFLNPLSIEIWGYVAGAYVTVCFTLFVVARFTPNEWLAPPPCVGSEGVLENQFSFPNSVWFITGTLLRQGSGLNPKTTSTRLVGGIWWFFTLIIVSTYTANLAAFLTVDRKSTPIESAEDLADQSEISYGTLDSGSTMDFFRNSSSETYKKMWRYMESRPEVFVQTYEQGIKRVLQGNYAFLIESPMLDYVVQRDCNLTQIGGLLDSKGYGIAMPKGSPWRDKLSLAILELQEKGMIQLLYNKWWKNTGDVCNRDDKKDSRASPLGVDNIGGVFVVLFAGLVLAVLVAICEFCCHAKKSASLRKTHLCSEIGEDLKSALCCCRPPRTELIVEHPAHRRASPSSTYVPDSTHTTHHMFELPSAPRSSFESSTS